MVDKVFLFLVLGLSKSPSGSHFRRKSPLLLSAVLVVTSAVVFAAKKLFDYAAAPSAEKQSDFVFPPNADQEKQIVITEARLASPLTLEQRGGFTNDASHLNKTAIYGIVRVTSA